jgi:hypothetical protein
MKRSSLLIPAVLLLGLGFLVATVGVGEAGRPPCKKPSQPGCGTTTAPTTTTTPPPPPSPPPPPPAPPPPPQPPPPPPPSPTVIFKGDFETGDFSQWSSIPTTGGGGTATIGAAPVVQGQYAAKFVTPPSPTQHSRVEVDGRSITYGTRTIVEYDFMVDPSTPFGTNGRFEAAQWHPYSDPCYGGGLQLRDDMSMRFSFAGGRVLSTGGGCTYEHSRSWLVGTLVKGHWYHVKMDVMWHADPSIGFTHVWMDGVEVIPPTFMGTASTGETGTTPRNFRFRQGIYRVLPFNNTSTFYADGMTVQTVN